VLAVSNLGLLDKCFMLVKAAALQSVPSNERKIVRLYIDKARGLKMSLCEPTSEQDKSVSYSDLQINHNSNHRALVLLQLATLYSTSNNSALALLQLSPPYP
jgi:hypothetical protein